MQSPLVVEELREQLHRILDWYQQGPPRFRWGAVLHRRNERGKLRFGAVTPTGESLLLSEPMLTELAAHPCWLDGAVRVRLETRRLSHVTHEPPWQTATEARSHSPGVISRTRDRGTPGAATGPPRPPFPACR